jgi:hypothetical protein
MTTRRYWRMAVMRSVVEKDKSLHVTFGGKTTSKKSSLPILLWAILFSWG